MAIGVQKHQKHHELWQFEALDPVWPSQLLPGSDELDNSLDVDEKEEEDVEDLVEAGWSFQNFLDPFAGDWTNYYSVYNVYI